MTGATGSILGVRVLQALQKLDVETHLVMSKWAEATLKYELEEWTPTDVRALATKVYSIKDLSAPISSGSFQTDGMVIVPCSMKSLAAVRMGYADDLISRSADVILKERRRLVLVARETPLSTIHLDNMLSLSHAGAIVFPPVPAFYTKPKSLEDVVEQSVGRILDMFNLDTSNFERWGGMKWK
jgi:flavin prenyltransferase